MYHTEKIAILLATYNGEKYIAQQIDSILRQTNKDWKLYIHDDGSKDCTVSILEEYTREYPEQICIVDGAPTGGAKQNFFYLFHQVEAPYYMCCDQDDVWEPKKIEVTKNEMLRLEKEDRGVPCLVFTELKVVDNQLNILSESMSEYQGLDCESLNLNRAMIQNVVTGCTMMVNRCLRDELDKITDYNDVLMHDWWALLVATRFGKASFIKDATILYRQHGNNDVGAQNANTVVYMIKRMFQGNDIKKSLEDTRKQVAFFAEVYSEKEDSVLKQYANLGRKGKISRLVFYIKNDVKKSTWSKNLGLLLWG